MGRDHTGTFTEKIKRQVYLDKLRVLATVLVICPHGLTRFHACAGAECGVVWI